MTPFIWRGALDAGVVMATLGDFGHNKTHMEAKAYELL